jgi:hypothetical protein
MHDLKVSAVLVLLIRWCVLTSTLALLIRSRWHESADTALQFQRALGTIKQDAGKRVFVVDCLLHHYQEVKHNAYGFRG